MCKRLPHDKTVVTFSDHNRAAKKQLYTIPCREVIMGSGGGVFGGRVSLRRMIRHKLINCDISQVYHITWDEIGYRVHGGRQCVHVTLQPGGIFCGSCVPKVMHPCLSLNFFYKIISD